ncbi:MAG: hypothetical protein U0232_22020 [Thermomicrobiales bacterium]
MPAMTPDGVELNPANSEAFLARYQHFFDGLIRAVRLDFVPQQGVQPIGEPHRVIVECSVIDTQLGEPENWVNLVLNIHAASAIRLVRSNQTWIVLSQGLSIGFFDRTIYLAFDEQVRTRDEFLQADFLVTGERCIWSTLPYDDLPGSSRR